MTDLLLRDIDPILAERIQRVSVARGWSEHETIARLLEQGLFEFEQEVRGGLEGDEADVLAAAIAALKDVPAGKGF